MVSITCLWMKRQLPPYLQGALSPERARKVAHHLDGCVECQREVSRVERLIGLVRATLPTGPDPDWTGFWDGVRHRILTERPRPWREAWGRWLSWPISGYPRLALGGALAGVLLLAVVLWRSGPQEMAVVPPGVVVSAVETAHPDGSVLVFSSPEDEMTVIWVFGLDQPADQSRVRPVSSGGERV